MTDIPQIQEHPTDQPVQGPKTGTALKFGKNNGFHVELRRRVDAFFESTGLRQRDCPQMYVKTAILLATFAASYTLLVFVAQTWWQAVPLALLLGLTAAAIGFNIQHDGGHQAYSNYPWVNRLMAMTLDMIGASSYVWHWTHGVSHHTYVNIAGHDIDMDLGILGRVTPHQKRFKVHRWQHYYLWPFYGLMAMRWQLYGDFRDVLTGRIGVNRFPRPKGWNLAGFVAGKAWFFSLALLVPMLVHPVWTVLLFYAVAGLALGVALSTVFQLAHCVAQADFPLPRADTGRIENAWAVHQAETTVDFSRRSRLAAWLLGGLNFQIEHHLFPRICHVNYPALSKLVEETCREFGVVYMEHKSFWAGVAAHFRWLRQMGMPEASSLRRNSMSSRQVPPHSGL